MLYFIKNLHASTFYLTILPYFHIFSRTTANKVSESIAIGEATGEKRGEAKIVINMHNNCLTPEQISAFTNKDIDDIKAIIDDKIPFLTK